MTLWAGADQSINVIVLLGLMLTGATPLMLGASSGILSERAGTINMGIEGMMLMGAFVGAVLGSIFGQFVGVAGAIVAGTAGGLILATFCIRYRVDQIVAGIVLNIVALALTNFLFDSVLATHSDLNTVVTLGPAPIPVLEAIPVIGPVLFRQNLFGYAAFIVIIVLTFALDRTRWGLRVKAVGEQPHAAHSAGIGVIRVRYENLALSGAVAGFAGAYLAMGYLGGFQRNITNGVGFIAIAVMIVAGWQPRNVLPVALMFGFAQSLQGELSLLGAPIASEFLLMAPFVLTIIIVAGIVGQTRAPAADGVLFFKE
jgi:simple sugar transport system permease protein